MVGLALLSSIDLAQCVPVRKEKLSPLSNAPPSLCQEKRPTPRATLPENITIRRNLSIVTMVGLDYFLAGGNGVRGNGGNGKGKGGQVLGSGRQGRNLVRHPR